MRWLWVLALVSGLAACGSDDDNTASETPSVEEETPPVLSITGTITPAAGITFDSDLNDPASNITGTFTGNDTLQRAQPITNTATVHGYASYRSTGVRVDRFGQAYDEFDTYSTNLVPGQRIKLHVVDFDNEPLNGLAGADLDLALLDSNGNVVAASIGTGEFEKVDVPATGAQYIQVIGYHGISKYVLELGVGAPFATNTPASQFSSNDLIVKFTERSGGVSAQQVRTTYAGQLSHQDSSRASLLQLDSAAVSSASLGTTDRQARAQTRTLRTLKDLQARPDVEYAELNYLSQAQATSNDPGLAEQWHYQNINLPQAWDITTGLATPPVIVAVIDTGVYLEHPDLADKLVAGYDFISDEERSRDGDGIDDNPDDPGDEEEPGMSSFHGTHVAGIVAASSNNALGVAGVSWHAQIMPLRVMGMGGHGEDYDIIQAIRFAAGLPNDSETVPERRADIINLSLGGYDQDLEGSQAYQGAIDAAREAGVIIVAAAGNDDSSIPGFPASLHGVISVSATNSENGRASYSNYGPMIDVAAPGGDFEVDDGVYSTWVDDLLGERVPIYRSFEGTSLAAPHVAGVLALMKAVHPGLTPEDVDAVLAAGSLTRDIGESGRDNAFGFGLIDARRAVDEAERLAAGGAVPPVAFRLQAQPYMLDASISDNEPVTDELILRNLGTAPGTIQTVEVDEGTTWLAVGERLEEEVDGQMLGTYPVTISRGDLEDGYYGTEITVTYLASGRTRTLKIPVHLRVETPGGIGRLAPQYAMLLNQQGQTVVACPLPPSSEPQSFRFYDVEPGDYYLMAGSDIDQDERICEMGESCGALFAESEAELVEFDGGLLEGQNFDVGLDLSGWWPRGRAVTDEIATTTNAGCSSVREP